MLRFAIVNQLARTTLAKLGELKLQSARATLQDTARRLVRSSAAPAFLPGGLAAFGAGIAVGAGLGVLFAPKSGAELRASLRDKFTRKSSAPEQAPASGPRAAQSATGSARPTNGGNGAPG